MFGFPQKEKEPPLCKNAITVAEFLIQNAGEIKMTNLRLNKMLFFVQGYCLTKTGRACFPDSIEAWTRGPVVYSVYSQTKKYGGNPLPNLNPYVDYAVSGTELERLLKEFLARFGSYSTDELVKVSMSEKSPWRKTDRFCVIAKKDIGLFVGDLMRENHC